MEVIRGLLCLFFVGLAGQMGASSPSTLKNHWIDQMLQGVARTPLPTSLSDQAQHYANNIQIDESRDPFKVWDEKEKMKRMFAIVGALQGWEKVNAMLKLRSMYEQLQVEAGRRDVKERLEAELQAFKG